MKLEDEEEYKVALRRASILMDLLDITTCAIEEYENIHYPTEKPSLLTKIKFRLGQRFAWLNW